MRARSSSIRLWSHEAARAASADHNDGRVFRERVGEASVDEVGRAEDLADEAAVADVARSAAFTLGDGRIVTGGGVLTDGELAHGHYVQLTVVDGLPHEHELMRQEQFLPFVGIIEVSSLDEALQLANDTLYGLTAGIYSEDPDEVERFFDTIEAGVVYANRRAGATTGAWPGTQAFGGWKGSASTARGSGGPYYLQQYLREQSLTVIE